MQVTLAQKIAAAVVLLSLAVAQAPALAQSGGPAAAGNSLEVTDPQGTIRKYALDGKPVTRATETGMQKAVVTANVQGETLVIGTTQPFGGMPGNATLEVKEVWSVSPDGKTLTVTTTRTLPAQQKTFKQVYNR